MLHLNIDILKVYKNLGGKIITIGSDAHNINDLMANFSVASNILEESDFDNISVYHQRKRSIVKLKDLKQRKIIHFPLFYVNIYMCPCSSAG